MNERPQTLLGAALLTAVVLPAAAQPRGLTQWHDTTHGFWGYHGHWASHIKRMDPHVGTLADYKRLSDALGRWLAVSGELAMKHALLALMTLPGIPVLYYGTERGLVALRKAHRGFSRALPQPLQASGALCLKREMADLTRVWGLANGFDHVARSVFVELPGRSFTPAAEISTDNATRTVRFIIPSEALGAPAATFAIPHVPDAIRPPRPPSFPSTGQVPARIR